MRFQVVEVDAWVPGVCHIHLPILLFLEKVGCEHDCFTTFVAMMPLVVYIVDHGRVRHLTLVAECCVVQIDDEIAEDAVFWNLLGSFTVLVHLS